MSRAPRAAIWSRVSRFMSMKSRLSRAASGGCPGRTRYLDHAPHEDAGRDDRLGVERAQRDDLVDLRDRALGRARHDRPEVARRLPVDEIAPSIAAQRLDQCEVGANRMLEHVVAPIDALRLL